MTKDIVGKKDSEQFRRRAEANFRLDASRMSKKLFQAQMTLALGTTHLYCTVTTGEGKKRKKTTEIIEDPEVIMQFLSGELDNTEEEYFFISSKSPDNKAIDSLLNRAFGKPKETQVLETGENMKALVIYRPEKLPDNYDEKPKKIDIEQ